MSSDLLLDLMNTNNFREEFERLRSSVGRGQEDAGIAQLQKTLDDISNLLHHQTDERQAWKAMGEGLEGAWKGMFDSECVCNNPESLDARYGHLRDIASSRANKI